MTRQEFIDRVFISCAVTYTTHKYPITIEWCYDVAREFADERAKHCPFDDEPSIAKGEEQPESIYPWDEAPKDAKYATTSKDGVINWWSGKPTFDEDDEWGTLNEVRTIFIRHGRKIAHPDWRNSLEKRPENK